MLQLKPFNFGYQGLGGSYPQQDSCFDMVRRHVGHCGCHHHRHYFEENERPIRERCHGRNPHDYRTDQDGCRWENGAVAQTQITQQTSNDATIMAGNNKLTFNKSDQSLHIQNSDGTQQTLDLKVWGDPHAQQNGKDLGMFKKNIEFTLKDGTDIKLLMGDGNGGKPQADKPTYIDSAAIRTRGGTGAVVSGISGPGDLKVSALDSSYSGDFMADQAMNKFGNYESSHVFIDRDGNMIDKANGQKIHDQNGLDRLDQEQTSQHAARRMYDQGYVPRELADRYDCPFDRYDDGMRYQCQDMMSQMLQQYRGMQYMFSDDCQLQMPVARFNVTQNFYPRGYQYA